MGRRIRYQTGTGPAPRTTARRAGNDRIAGIRGRNRLKLRARAAALTGRTEVMADTNAGTATTEGTLPTVAVEGPAAQALAESAAVIGDLQFVMECCKRLLTELAVPEEDRDPLVPQALWSAALNGYARCFGKGSRPGLTVEDVRRLPLEGEVVKYHKWLLAERGRQATRAVNPFDEVRVGAVLSPPDAPARKLRGIAILPVSHVLVDETGVRQLGGLASELARQSAEQAREQQEAVLAETRQQDIGALAKQPLLRMLTPADESAARDEPAART